MRLESPLNAVGRIPVGDDGLCGSGRTTAYGEGFTIRCATGAF
jgi:hypothetical protein